MKKGFAGMTETYFWVMRKLKFLEEMAEITEITETAIF